jgi:hypothetical protein
LQVFGHHLSRAAPLIAGVNVLHDLKNHYLVLNIESLLAAVKPVLCDRGRR